MGFGWLLIGYFFANIMSLYSPLSVAMLVGYPMMIYGLWRLAPYHRYFRFSFYYSFLSLPFALYFSAYGLAQLFPAMGDAALFAGALYTTMEWCYFVFSLGFQALLLLSIAGLSGELQLRSVQSSAWRNLIMVGLYYLIDGFARLPIPWIAENKNLFSLSLILLRLCYIFFNIYLIFQCYRHICPEEDRDMPDPTPKKKPKEKEEHHEE